MTQLDRTPADIARRRPQCHRAIMTATADLLGEIGYQHLTFDKVAKRAGVAKTTIYRWWPTKTALVLELIDELIHAAPPIISTGSTRSDLREMIRATLNLFHTDPLGPVIPAVALDVYTDPHQFAQFDHIFRPARTAASRIIAHAVRAGELPVDVDTALLIDLCAGTIMFRVLISHEQITRQLIDQLVGLLLDGTPPTLVPNQPDAGIEQDGAARCLS